ncbi:MAG TPA: flavodoxin domain-containing protein [Solirubrobacteraceae bacterium]|nr:flavodoxin domain-containing protein [Solirubrobacteraceae bacterium]
MNALVVYESVYGNTRAVAEAIADGLDGADVVPVHRAPAQLDDVDLLVVGGPTHMHGMTTARSRRLAVDGVHEDGAGHVEPDAAEEPGLRAWIRELPDRRGARAVTFDTRLDRSPWLTGVASRGIAKRLRRHGYEILATDSFLVQDAEGPLADGELERARAWGMQVAASAPVAASTDAS